MTEQILTLASTVPDRYRALITTAAGTGLRPGELFGLSVDRVDFLRKQLRVDRQLVRTRGLGVELGPLKTSSSYRSIPLPRTVSDALAAHLACWSTAYDPGSRVHERSRRPDSAVPVLGDVGARPHHGRPAGVGDPARSPALLREPADPLTARP